MKRSRIITDETGLCSDIGQLRNMAHNLATTIIEILETDGVIEALGPAEAAEIAAIAGTAHAATCIASVRQVFEIPGGEKTWQSLSNQRPQLN